MDFSLPSDLDRKIVAITGYGARRGFGEAPALVIVDAQNKFVGLDRPILESMAVYSFARKRLPHEQEPRAPKDGGEIVAPLRPAGPGREWVVDKKYASAFFGTPLITFLNTLRRDTLVVAGFDMNLKYADVIGSVEAAGYLEG